MLIGPFLYVGTVFGAGGYSRELKASKELELELSFLGLPW